MTQGTLIAVGIGIKLAQQCTPEARQAIETADVVYTAGGDPVTQRWLSGLNAKTVSLQTHYRYGKSRRRAYEEMVEAILVAVRKGKRVCAAFYGHPGIFVYASHRAIERARAEGFEARMLPGVSAEDCLFADLGVDPGRDGCQSYEASDWLINARSSDTASALILWQIAVVADRSLKQLSSDPKRIAILGEVLMRYYPPDHIVTVYEAAIFPTGRPKIEHIPLRDLHRAVITQQSTLYVPRLARPRPSAERLALIAERLEQG
ncbi:MAG: SAM-dependent methyltransferase [Caulobacteraceae bacterium]